MILKLALFGVAALLISIAYVELVTIPDWQARILVKIKERNRK